MKKDWEVKNLSDICDVFVDGNWIESKDQSQNGIRLVQTGNIGCGYFKNKIDKARYVSEDTFKRLKCTEIFPNDILTSRLPDPVGKSCLIPNINSKMITGVDCTIIRTKKNVLPFYLLYFQMSNQYLNEVKSMVTGTTRSRISRKNLGLINVPIAPINEQKRIVEKLDTCMEQVDKAIQNVEQNIQNVEDLFQSYLNEIFSQKDNDWETKKLGDISRLTYGITGKAYDSGDYRYVRITDIDDYGKLSYKNKKYLKNQNECANFILKENDLVMARTGATFGKLLLYKDIEPSVYASYLIKIEFINDISNELYWFFTKTKIYWDQANSLSTGSAQPHFNGAALKEVLFSYPISKNKQKILIQKFYEQFSLSQSIKLNYQKEILALKELKQSILEKAFNGEL